MGIGFVILIWFIFFVIATAIWGILKYLSDSFYIFDVLKDAFQSFVLVFLILIGAGMVISGFDFILDRFSPNHVFSHSFGFSPTSDVHNLEGSRLVFGDSGYSKLKFQADKITVERIFNEHLFVEQTKGSYQKSPDNQFRELLNRPNSKVYLSSKFKSEFVGSSSAIMIYDEKNKEVYFTWNGVD